MPVSRTSPAHLLLAAITASLPVGAQTTVWTGSGNWNSGGNWSNGSPGSGTTAIFDGQGGASVSINGNRSARGLVFDGGQAYTISGNNTLNLGAAGIQMGSSAAQVLSVPTLAFGNNAGAGDIAVNGGGALTIASAITGGGGVSLNKSGNGLLILTGANTYSGPTTVSGGILRIANGSALGSSVFDNNVAAGAALEFAGNFTLNQTGLILSGAGVGGTGALRSISGSNAYNNQLQLNAAGVSVGVDAGASLSLGGAVNGGVLAKVGAGTLAFTGAAAYNASGLVVDAGTVILNRNANSNFVGSTVTVNNGTLRLAANQQIADFQTVTVNAPGLFDLDGRDETLAALVLGGGTVATGTGVLTFINSATPVTSNAGATTATIAGNVVLTAANSAFSVADGAAATDLSVTAAIASSGAFQQFLKTGEGTLALSGANTFTTAGFGGVRIQAGVLQVSADNNLGNAGNRVLLEGGALRAAGSFVAADNRVFETSGPGGAIDVTVGNTVTLNTADRLRGAAALTKTGDGTLALNQANTNFTGNAALMGGTTRLGSRQSLGANASATHTVGAGATLEAAFSHPSDNFQANLVLAGGAVVRTGAANQKAGFQNNNAGSSLTVTADSVVRDAGNDGGGGFLTFDGVVNIQSGARLTADSATANGEVRFGGSQNIVLASGATLATAGAGLVSLGSGSARTIIGQGAADADARLVLGAANHASNAGSRFQVNGSGVGGLRVEGAQAAVDAFVTDARLAATAGSGGTLTIAYTDAGNRTLGVTANLAAASDVMLGLESAGGVFTLDGSLANWGGLVVGPSTTVAFGAVNVFGADDALVMRGGTITLGATSQTFDTFEVLGSSVLDFGSGDGTLTVGSLAIAEGATLTVRNWTESADHFFSQFDPGEANLARVYFEAQDKSGAWNKYGDPFEITPVPEPSAYGALALGGLVGWTALRRRRRA